MGLSDRYPGTMLALGGLLQVAILWTFLTAFYQVYISRVETRALDHQMSDLIRRNVPKALAKADTPAKSLKSLLRSLDLGRVADLYRRPDEAVETSNRWLFVVAWVVAAALFGGVAVLLAVVFGSCGLEGAGPDVLDVVRENVWLFLVVGVVEFLFFQHIAAKFIPAAPSDLVHGLLRRLRGSGPGRAGPDPPASRAGTLAGAQGVFHGRVRVGVRRRAAGGGRGHVRVGSHAQAVGRRGRANRLIPPHRDRRHAACVRTPRSSSLRPPRD